MASLGHQSLPPTDLGRVEEEMAFPGVRPLQNGLAAIDKVGKPIDENSACVEVGKPIDENSACVEVGTTHKHLRRGDKSNNFKNYFSSNDITCEEVKSVDSQRFYWIHRTCEQQGSQKKKKR
ncbi:hypothetical protein TNCV_2298361 [Trichonephila clavipes]|nr:hypothetical protein TNCV_2298361 [Trichonephila clavipes]